jgi:aspartate kinase
MLVLKFGGTSVATPKLIDNVLDISWNQKEKAPVLVASAMGKTTDALVRIGDYASEGLEKLAYKEVSELRESHESALQEMLSGALLEDGTQRINQLFQELSSLIRGLTLIKEVTKRSRDTLTILW